MRQVFTTIGRWLRKALRILWMVIRKSGLFLVWLVCMAVVITLLGSWYAIDHYQLSAKELPVLTRPDLVQLPGPISVWSSDGELIGQTTRQRRVIVNEQMISPYMRNATIAIEDQRFYQHGGVDIQAILRAAYIDFQNHQYTQGGSTLTMQYVRNIYLNQQKTTHRKLQEIALALQLESIWSKKRILTAYLNTVYYGNGAYGVEAAAQEYFHQHASDLTVAQAALIAGITNNPVLYNPRTNFNVSWTRAKLIITEMFAQNMITKEQELHALSHMPKIRKSVINQKINNVQLFTAAMAEAKKYLPSQVFNQGGFRIQISINMKDQRYAQQRLRAVYASTPAPKPVIAATFLHPQSGRIIIQTSSRPTGYFNFASQARRQPGSTVKLFTTATYLRNGGQTIDSVDNSPVEVKDGKHHYTIEPEHSAATVGEALRYSQNPAFWRLYQQAGPRKVLALERRLGLKGMDANPAAALGGVRYGATTTEMAGAAGAFANNGVFYPPHMDTAITTPTRTLWTDRNITSRQALEPEYAKRLNQIAQQVVTNGFQQLQESVTLQKSRAVAGKTGTTEDNADAWFIGYTPDTAGAVWTGYPKSRKPLRDVGGVSGEVFGAEIPAGSWNTLAKHVLQGVPASDFSPPLGVRRIPKVTGLSPQAAQARIAQFGLYNVKLASVFNPRVKREIVLRVTPRAGTFVKPSTPITVQYQQSSRPTPSFIGKTYLQVYEQLGRYIRLQPKLVASTAPTGTVLAQYPTPGEPISAGGTLQLTLSTRRAPAIVRIKKVEYVPTKSELAKLRRQLEQARASAANATDQVVIPDLVGLQSIDAGQVLSSIGLEGVIKRNGLVISQSPIAGEKVSSGSTVTLHVGTQ